MNIICMLPNPEDLESARTDPGKMLAVANAYAHDLQFTEALQWYRTYLCHCPQDNEARQAMRALEQSRADYQRMRGIYDFVDKCNSRLRLSDAELSQNLQLLHRSIGRGASQEAEDCARLVQQQLEAVMRAQWQLGEGDDLWWEATQRASALRLYEFAVELLERSPHNVDKAQFYAAMSMASSLLEDLEIFKKRRGRETAKNLREAIDSRDIDTLNAAIAEAFDFTDSPDEDTDDDSPGQGVPRRPRPPSLDGQARKPFNNWN